MRNHADAESREQEFYRFTDVLPAIRNMLNLRYALLPYLYSEFMKAALEDAPYFRPLAFDYPADPDAREVDDQLLLGEGLMVAPVHTQNAHGRTVYLPETMKMLRLRSVSDYDEEVLPAGRHYLPCELGEVLLFIRPGHTVPAPERSLPICLRSVRPCAGGGDAHFSHPAQLRGSAPDGDVASAQEKR